MTKSHRLLRRKQKAVTKTLPLNFLLGCGQQDLEDFELNRLAEIADLRRELHEVLDRVIDATAQAALAAWFKVQDRQTLKHAIENEETPVEMAKRLIREGQRSAEELIPRSALEPGVAHRAASLKYQSRNIAEGKCRYCPKPLDRNSVDMCTEHLAKHRTRARTKKGLADVGSREYLYAGEIPESTHGRTPGTLQSLALSREKKTRAVLADLGLPPESAATALGAAKAALLAVMPQSKKDALLMSELLDKGNLGEIESTAKKALLELVSSGQVQRGGRGIRGNPYVYFVGGK